MGSLENSSQNASAGSAAQTPPGPDFAQFFQNVAQTTLQNSSEQGTASLEQLFQGFGQAFEGLVETIDQGNGVPPTSASALETIPKVKITAQDLEESQNCHCTVCIEDFVLGEEALRLPCGHLFHEHCIKTWLQKHSQCPVCRYELPTDNVSYEQGRQARMSERRPRMRCCDLAVKGVNELRCLAQHLEVNLDGCLEKDEIVKRICTSGKVELIPDDIDTTSAGPRSHERPPLVSREELQAKSIREIKAEMERVGVDPRGCLEKQDMIDKLLNQFNVGSVESQICR